MYTTLGVVHILVTLPTFPVFVLYLAAVFTYRYWRLKIPVYDLKWIITWHNVFCIALSLAAWLAFTWYLMFRADSIYSKRSDPLLQRIFVLYSCSKGLELLDTVFMMLRHKGRQISLLHVYHHASMFLLSDCGYRIFPWPCMAVPIAINSFVHVLVYSYYLATNLGMDVSPYKKYLTQVQLIQFIIGLPFMYQGIVYHGFCIYGLLFDLTMIGLFGNFYVRNYLGWLGGLKKKERVE